MHFLSKIKGRRAARAVAGSSSPPTSVTQRDQSTAQPVEASHISSAKKIFPIGITLLHEPPEPALVDVIFIHGLTGDRERTWTAMGQTEPWPKTLLPTVLPKARILTFGYDAYVTSFRDLVSKNRIGNHAKDLLGKLAIYRGKDDTENRPIFFVCHSLGGLVCIDALAMSNTSRQPHLKRIVDCTRGVMFLGTPHSGSAMAKWAERLAKFIGLVHEVNPKILEVLKEDSEVLERIQGSFYDMLGTREDMQLPKISIICFFEQLPLKIVGEVVPKHSAILPQYESIGIHANHMDMTKFSDEDDDGFLNISGKLFLWAKALATGRRPEPSPAIRPPFKKRHKEMTPKEASARHYATEVLLEEDDEATLTVSLPTKLLGVDAEHRVQFIHPDRLAVLRSSWSRLLSYYQSFPACRDSTADPRRQRYSLSFAPWLDGVFLASIPCTDVWRILSGTVSERQHTTDAVLVHRFMFSVSQRRYENSPVLIASYRPSDGHSGSSTVVPSKDLADAIVGSGGLSPTDALGPNFICTEKGYERVQMPYALFLTVLPRYNCVLLNCQMRQAFSLLDLMLPIVDRAWDHDDAYECSPDDVPIKIRVDALHEVPEWLASIKHYTSGDPPDHTAFDLWTAILQQECKKYFEGHRDAVEIEDILRLLRTVEKAANDTALEVDLEGWFAQFGVERTRWLLLVLVLTLLGNVFFCPSLPVAFDVLGQSEICYIT